MTTRDIRAILASFDINSISLESKNNCIAEEFKVNNPGGAPHVFTLSHKGTPVSMANAFSTYVGGTALSGEFEEPMMMQLNDASSAIKSAIIGKPKGKAS